MSIGQGITTFLGALIIAFVVRICWGKMVEIWGPLGGWMAAAFITGPIWLLNHGLGKPFINQSSSIWVDMGLAVAVGVWIASAKSGLSIKESYTNIGAAVIGGIIGAFILSLTL